MCLYRCVWQGSRGSFGRDWFYFNWSQDWLQAIHFHINETEVAAVTLADYRWAPFWRNKRIIIYSDNTVMVSALNKGTCRNDAIMRCIRSLFWLSASYNFQLTARFLPGVQNIAASRLGSPGHLETLWQYTYHSPSCICRSIRSFFCLTDSLTGDTFTACELDGCAIGASRTLPSRLDEEVLHYCANSFAASTSKTHSAQRSAFLKFCDEMKICPVPCLRKTWGDI